MGTNFHTAWIDRPTLGHTHLNASEMNPALSDLDRGVTYLKNIITHCDGVITYNPVTGVLAWSDVLRILFNRTDGQAIQNTVATGDITLSDNEFAYVDLNETNNSVLTVQKAAVTTGAASNFMAYNRVILGYRNTASDQFYPVYLRKVEEAVIILTSAASVTVDWNKGRAQKITLAHDVAFTFSGGKEGTGLILRVKQNDSAANAPSWPGTIRYGDDITSITISATLSKKTYLGFIYDADDAKYDLVSDMKGF